MNHISNFAERLKIFRENNKLSFSELEKITDIPAPTLNRYETGQRVPKIDTAVGIATSLNVSPLWLLGYDVSIDYQVPEHFMLDRLLFPMPHDEQDLVMKYRALDDRGKRNVLAILESEFTDAIEQSKKGSSA